MTSLRAAVLWSVCLILPSGQLIGGESSAAEDRKVPGKSGRVRTDRYGDPLPPGAIARIGTVRLRHGNTVYSAAFSPDSKTLATVGHDGIRIWDAVTGKPLRDYCARLHWFQEAVFAPDGRSLWLFREEIGSPKEPGDIYRWDLAKGLDEKPVLAPFRGPHTNCFAVSPDGKALASGNGPAIPLWEIATGKKLHTLRRHAEPVEQLAFAAGGKILGSLDRKGQLIVWDVPARKPCRSFRATDGENRLGYFALSPDGKTVAAAFTSRTIPLRIWDVSTGEERWALRGQNDSIGHLTFSPDGKTLAACGSVAGCDGLHAWKASFGEKCWSRPVECRTICKLAVSPDGKTLATTHTLQVRLWDMATGVERLPVPDDAGCCMFVALLSDGRTLATQAFGRPLRFWQADTGEELPQPSQRPLVSPVAGLSADGRIMASTFEKDHSLRLCDVRTGKDLHRLPHNVAPGHCYFTRNGKWMVSEMHHHEPGSETTSILRLWEVGTGKEAGQFKGHQELVWRLAISPDDDRLATASHEGVIRLWDLPTCQEVRALPVTDTTITEVAYSLDGRLLAGAGWGELPLRLWEVITGKEVRILQNKQVKDTHGNWALALVFSPDGRRLITSDNEGGLYCWDVPSGCLRHQWQAHKFRAEVLALSADGKILVSRGGTTALLWDMPRLIPEERRRNTTLSAANLEALWMDLQAEDATRAYRAIWKLAEAPDQTLPLLRQRLRPANEADQTGARRVSRLLADLDSDSFAVRQKASRDLAALGSEAAPLLRKALARQPSLEMRRRIEDLLRTAAGSNPPPPPSPDLLRKLRGVAVLEHIGSPEARRLLQVLADGVADAALTQDARASLRRLERRPLPRAERTTPRSP